MMQMMTAPTPDGGRMVMLAMIGQKPRRRSHADATRRAKLRSNALNQDDVINGLHLR
jgi:hypothetical protein